MSYSFRNSYASSTSREATPMVVYPVMSVCSFGDHRRMFLVGLLLRLSGGEPLLHFPAIVHYPMYDIESATQYFPFKSMSMLASLSCCIATSLISIYLFKNGIIPAEYDVLNCVVNVSYPLLEGRLPLFENKMTNPGGNFRFGANG